MAMREALPDTYDEGCILFLFLSFSKKKRIFMEDHLHFVTEGHKFPNLKSYKGKHLNKSVVVPEQWALKPNSSGITGK